MTKPVPEYTPLHNWDRTLNRTEAYDRLTYWLESLEATSHPDRARSAIRILVDALKRDEEEYSDVNKW
jgi:hypothetical protein